MKERKPMDKDMEPPSFYTMKWLADFTVESVVLAGGSGFTEILSANPQVHQSHEVRAAIIARLNDANKSVAVKPVELPREKSDFPWINIRVTWPKDAAPLRGTG